MSVTAMHANLRDGVPCARYTKAVTQLQKRPFFPNSLSFKTGLLLISSSLTTKLRVKIRDPLVAREQREEENHSTPRLGSHRSSRETQLLTLRAPRGTDYRTTVAPHSAGGVVHA